MADSSLTPVEQHDACPADAHETLDQILTEGIHQGPKGVGLREAQLAATMSGAFVFSGTVLPMPPEVLTPEERERVVRAFEG